MHTSLGMGLPPTIFIAQNTKIGEKFGVLAYIGGSVGGIAPNFSTSCVPIGHKMSLSNCGCPSPRKITDYKKLSCCRETACQLHMSI